MDDVTLCAEGAVRPAADLCGIDEDELRALFRGMAVASLVDVNGPVIAARRIAEMTPSAERAARSLGVAITRLAGRESNSR